MAKLSRAQIKQHEKSCKLLEKKILTVNEKIFIYENWNPSATHLVSRTGAFFTPYSLARDFSIEIYGDTIIDLCAGIGILSFIYYQKRLFDYAMDCKDGRDKINITCIEQNQDYIDVGKKLFPEATWIQGSVLDEKLIRSLGYFDCAISNPPFGKIKQNEDINWLEYKNSEFEYKVINVASKIAKYGIFLLPQYSTPFRYSGAQYFIDYRSNKENFLLSNKYKTFNKQTKINFDFNCGIDTSIYKNDWQNVSPICEIICCDFQ